MANPTTYFGWVMPTSTDLVTDLPADFNVFGQGVDTSLQYLLGGTTGQVLSKTSGTNMAFTWVTPTDQTPLTTKGDLFTFTTVDARLAVGANDTVLTADSTAATGLKWATPAAASGPAFVAYLGTNQTGMADSVAEKIKIDTEVFDTDSCFNTTTYRFTPTKAGKYLVTQFSRSALTHTAYVLKNGTGTQFCVNGTGSYGYTWATSMIEMNGSSDYLEMWGLVQTASGSFLAGQDTTGFQAVWIRS